jgi:hypothetical protein
MPTADDFRAELRPQLRAAEIAGKPHVDITSGTLHRAVGDYPNPSRHRMPVCCDVMRREMGVADEVLDQPEKGSRRNSYHS